jgi:Mg/Co/Ni transporter MgtE
MKEMEQGASPAELESDVRARALLEEIRSRGLDRVAHLLAQESEATVATLLTLLPERDVAALLPTLEADRRTAILKSVSPKKRDRWLRNPH